MFIWKGGQLYMGGTCCQIGTCAYFCHDYFVLIALQFIWPCTVTYPVPVPNAGLLRTCRSQLVRRQYFMFATNRFKPWFVRCTPSPTNNFFTE